MAETSIPNEKRTMLYRNAILGATQNTAVKLLVRKYGMRLGAARFVAGEALDEAIRNLTKLDEQGLHTNTTVLGEYLETIQATKAVAEDYVCTLDAIAAAGIKTNIALKLTQLGVDFGPDVVHGNLGLILDRANELGNFIRLDMEDSTRVDATLDVYRHFRNQGYDNIGAVLQANLRRSEADLHELMDIHANVRLVKGAYLEPASVAFTDKEHVDENFKVLIEKSLRGGTYTAIATHDSKMIEFAKHIAEEHNVPRTRFEFQMLYGVRAQYQRDLFAEGFKVLVATPYGTDWYPYLMRRLAERPENVKFMLGNFFKR